MLVDTRIVSAKCSTCRHCEYSLSASQDWDLSTVFRVNASWGIVADSDLVLSKLGSVFKPCHDREVYLGDVASLHVHR